MERVGLARAGGSGRVEDDLLEAIGDTGSHGAGLVARHVVEDRLETGRGVMHVDEDGVAGVHEQCLTWVWRERAGSRLEQRTWRTARHAVTSDEREIE